eukprot:52806-Eustigmatos_ZCMA.PRE.1
MYLTGLVTTHHNVGKGKQEGHVHETQRREIEVPDPRNVVYDERPYPRVHRLVVLPVVRAYGGRSTNPLNSTQDCFEIVYAHIAHRHSQPDGKTDTDRDIER